MLETSVVNVPSLDGGNEVWLEALPARTYFTPQYGEIQITHDKLQNFVKNFDHRVRGQDIAIDYDHGMDRAKGNQASGWMKELAIKPSSDDPTQLSLFARVELTDDAAKEVKDKKFRYFSLEWDDGWVDNNGVTHSDVIMGGALTNRPIAKKIMPINFSEALWEELDYETKKEFAVWPSKYIDKLPDTAFLYVEPNGTRHFPYRDAEGKVDLPHLRNAVARIPQAGAWLSEAVKESLQSDARDLMVKGETKEWEHSEPGTGSPPQPRTDEDGSDDPAIREGWRVGTPPDQDAPAGPGNPSSEATTSVTEGGTLTTEQEYELRRILNLDADSDIIEAARLQLGELTELKRTVDAVSEERKFAEQYPAYWDEHNKLMKRDRENSARSFSESVQKVRKAEGYGLKETQKGLSAMSLTKINDLHVKFAEGNATIEEFEDVIRTIVNGGVVQFGEIGSSTSDDVPIIDTSSAPGIAGARRLFGEVVAKLQSENPEWDYRKALDEAARKHPDLAEAYTVSLPG